MLWWKLQVLETGGIDTGGKCRYRKLQVQLTCVENAGTGKLRYSFNNNETLKPDKRALLVPEQGLTTVFK